MLLPRSGAAAAVALRASRKDAVPNNGYENSRVHISPTAQEQVGTALAPSPELNGTVNRLGNRRLSPAQLQRLARLEPVRVDEVAGNGANGYRKDAVPHNGRRSQ